MIDSCYRLPYNDTFRGLMPRDSHEIIGLES